MGGEARISGIWPRTIWPNILVCSLGPFHPTTATVPFFFCFIVFEYQQNPNPLPWIPFLQFRPWSANPTYSDLTSEPLCKRVMSWNPKHWGFLCLISMSLLHGHTCSHLFCAPVAQSNRTPGMKGCLCCGISCCTAAWQTVSHGGDGLRLNSNSWRTGINPFMRVESHDLRSVGMGGTQPDGSSIYHHLMHVSCLSVYHQ